MVSRGSLMGDDTIDAHPARMAHLPSKTVVKETHREPNTLENPTHNKKDGQTLNRAQDVAELKDYVCIAAPRIKAPGF